MSVTRVKSVQRTCVTPFAAANRTHAIHHKNGVEPSGRVVRQETQGCRTVVALNSTRRSLLAGALLIAPTLGTSPAWATGLESVPLPLPPPPSKPSAQQQKLADAEAAFAESDLVKELRERSEQNRDRYRKELENKYCFRQAELGVGDCAGLRLIPGMTRSGKQKTPSWLAKFFGTEEDD